MDNQIDWVRGTKSVYRGDGVTSSEKYLKALCERSFLSLWSYPNLYSSLGKELCDLLVVFDNHILIFSDKKCQFPATGNLELDWERWFRGAVEEAAKQIYGAERKLLANPEKLFLNAACTKPFPLNIPKGKDVKIHRIVVAHGASERCKREFGGSGSLALVSMSAKQVKLPFTLSQINSQKGFIHVFDDTALDIVLGTLDTITDFLAYLTQKEAFFQCGLGIWAAGEDELLAAYFQYTDENGKYAFPIPQNFGDLNSIEVTIDEGMWEKFNNSPQRTAQIEANAISYVWDKLIEKFNFCLLEDARHFTNVLEVKDIELAHRLLAREFRARRKVLAEALCELVKNAPIDRRSSRIVKPLDAGNPHYVFVLLPHLLDENEEVYRENRRHLLLAQCLTVKLLCPEAEDVIGIATEPGIDYSNRSEDLMYLDMRKSNEEEQRLSHELRELYQLYPGIK